VEYFLDQCLQSVFHALQHVSGQVFVVDNNSVDGSVQMIQKKYPQVQLIANDFNAGFSRANNMAIEQAEGEYVLLLNPDTVVEEYTFAKVIDFMDNHQDAGGLGVKMVDGKGRFLPESKRGLPTPQVAFYKIFGLSTLFPKSKKFGKYHLGYLDKNQTHQIEILSGAFMLLRKSTLDKIGLLDETFFMYGEDIDLSYRIVLGGWKNYYFADTSIIHYKGESTKKSSVNYVFVFYRAMVIFANKHFSQNKAKTFSFLINFAIWFRASLALLIRFARQSWLFALDVTIITALLLAISAAYQHVAEKSFDFELEIIALTSYSVMWVLSVLYSGGYDRPVKWYRLLKGTLAGTLIIMAGYAMLNKEFQFSRIVILLGAAASLTYFLTSRWLFAFIGPKSQSLSASYNRRFLIVGQPQEAKRAKEILELSIPHIELILKVSPTSNYAINQEYAGTIDQLSELVTVHKINEIVFCSKDIDIEQIIKVMTAIGTQKIDFKIAPPDALILIGSNSIHRSGDLYTIDVNGIVKPNNRRVKRLFDVATSFVFILLGPIMMWFTKKPISFLTNAWRVFSGQKTWVGYGSATGKSGGLPYLRKGVLSPSISEKKPDEPLKLKLDQIYARQYNVLNDFRIVFSNLNHLHNI